MNYYFIVFIIFKKYKNIYNILLTYQIIPINNKKNYI